MGKDVIKSFRELGKIFDKSSEIKPRSLGAAAVNEETDIGSVEKLAKKAVESVMGKDILKRDRKNEYKNAIDLQISDLGWELKKAEKSLKIVEKKKIKQQIEKYQNQIEFFKKEIKKAEEVKERAEKGKEAGKTKTSEKKIEIKETIQSLAQKIFEIRMTGWEGKEVDELLERRKINPNTSEADKLMEIWDEMLARDLIKTKRNFLLSEQRIKEAIKDSLQNRKYEKKPEELHPIKKEIKVLLKKEAKDLHKSARDIVEKKPTENEEVEEKSKTGKTEAPVILKTGIQSQEPRQSGISFEAKEILGKIEKAGGEIQSFGTFIGEKLRRIAIEHNIKIVPGITTQIDIINELKKNNEEFENKKEHKEDFGKSHYPFELMDQDFKELLKIEKVETGKKIELTNDQQAEIEQKLNKFKLRWEDVKKMDGFEELSYDQRLLVLENLKQLTLNRIQEEALIEYKENVNKSNFLGKIWNSITKKYQITKREKLIAENFQQLGIEAHGEVLEQLVKDIKDMEGSLTDQQAQSENELGKKTVKKEIEKMPEQEKKKIGLGLLNLGFYVTKLKSDTMAWICDKAVIGSDKPIQEQGTIKRFLASIGETYKKDSEKASKQMESPDSLIKSAFSAGQIVGGILKYGRTVADVAGLTVGSPLRYVMLGAQFFARGAGAVKETRLINQEVIEKTRIKNINEAAEEAWKIYEQVKIKAGGKEILGEDFKKAYLENLPQDLLERLKKSEPGTATGILQRVLKKDLELAIKYGRVDETRLREYDRLISQYGTVDALALSAKYAETAGKVVVAGVQIETAALLIQRIPEIMEKLFLMSGLSDIKPSEDPHFEGILKLRQEALEIAQKSELENTQAHLVEIATIKKGEGIWQAVYRQLDDQLKYNPEKFGLAKEDLQNHIKIKEILNEKTGKLLMDQGYIKPDGAEIRIVKSGVKIILNADNKINIGNGGKNTYEWQIKGSGQNNLINESNKSNEKIFNIFNQQKTIPEKWKIIQEYRYDIDSMKRNLAKFEDPQIKVSMQAEIDRLEKIEHSLIGKLAEQTEQTTEISQSAGTVKTGIGEKAAEIINGLSSEKQNIFNSFFENKSANNFSTSDVEKLAEQIKKENITADDFEKYYINKIGGEKLSPEFSKNLKNNFEIINKGVQTGKAQEYLRAKRAIQVIIQKMLSK